MNDYPIDIVVTWVDGADPKWLRERSHFRRTAGDEAGEERYRDWGLLRYWFRGIEKNASWVNRIFFVTWGHVPDWLNLDSPKLKVVRHADFIPERYLPTFSARTIELNLHRIEGLSEHFVYFNDDMFLTNPVSGEDFFRNGKPVGMAAFSVQNAPEDLYRAVLFNNVRLINRNFDKRDVVKKNLWKYLNPAYGKYNIRTLLSLPWSGLVGFYNPHGPSPLLKSTYDEVWEKEGSVLDTTCQKRFRGETDVNQYALLYWQYCKGEFVPYRFPVAFCRAAKETDRAVKLINDRKLKCVCLNDSASSMENVEKAAYKLRTALEEKFPYVSQFEKGIASTGYGR